MDLQISLLKYFVSKSMSLSANNLTVEIHNKLEPQIWDKDCLCTEIKEALLDIAAAFIEFIDIDVDLEDVIFTGSLANYNYTKYSDIDLHIVTDFKQYDADADLLKDYFDSKRTIWNITRDITVKGYEVELYIQDVNEKHYSTGVYSLKKDEWVTKPKELKDKDQVDKASILKKKNSMLELIDYALSNDCDVDCATKTKEKFMKLRKLGLEQKGELSPENLAFKELRRSGDVERLMKGIVSKKDKELTLEHSSFKSFLTATINKRGPRHQSLGAGMRQIVDPDAKSINMVAQSHKSGNAEPKVHQLKKQHTGGSPIALNKAMQIIARYNLDINKIRSGVSRALSTSGIQIGFNATTNSFYLSK